MNHDAWLPIGPLALAAALGLAAVGARGQEEFALQLQPAGDRLELRWEVAVAAGETAPKFEVPTQPRLPPLDQLGHQPLQRRLAC